MPPHQGKRGGRPPPSREVTVSKALSLILRHAAEKEGLKMDSQGYANLADVLAWRKLKSLNATFAEVIHAVESSDKKRFALLHIPSAGAGTTTTTTTEDTNEADQEVSSVSGSTVPTTPAGQDTATQTALLAAANDTTASHFLIRATQGHSIKSVEAAALMEKLTLDDPAKLPATVVHGTFHASWPAILSSGGLRCMGRNQVHFATGPAVEEVLSQLSNASASGMGKDAGVISGMRRDAQVLIYIDLKKALQAGCPFWRSENGVILSEGMSTQSGGSEQMMVPVEFFDVVVERKQGLGKLWERGEELQKLPVELLQKGNPKGQPRGHPKGHPKGKRGDSEGENRGSR